ncbi:hypothetical protein RRF57_004146 [Xylaria bambusicola]|uniref:Uncharacterized protein n=1 Tax=Xylaria bambusicola TaxID=326684 RepID=A0AAN7Z8D2_9PEZI
MELATTQRCGGPGILRLGWSLSDAEKRWHTTSFLLQTGRANGSRHTNMAPSSKRGCHFRYGGLSPAVCDRWWRRQSSGDDVGINDIWWNHRDNTYSEGSSAKGWAHTP